MYPPTVVAPVVAPPVVSVPSPTTDGSVVYQVQPTPLPASYGAGPVIAVAQ